MEFEGKLILVLPEEGGTSRMGNAWRKQGWVFETFGQYPKKVKVDAMNASIDNIHVEPGKVYSVSVDPESREFNGKWYTDLRIWSAREIAGPTAGPGAGVPDNPFSNPAPAPAAAAPQPQTNPFAPQSGAPGADAFGSDSNDDLPF
ncbi:MAG: DUF3127 domain-containing protein [Bacteroides sp.]|nr:DUF3127 domain-containing protein [Bacteroides sp.]